MNKRTFRMISAVFVVSCIHAQDADKLTITSPERDGVAANCSIKVQGRAVLKPGEHLWIFAARSNFADLGLVWLQGAVTPAPVSHEYSMPITLGIADDVGFDFRVSVAIVDDATHNKLQNKLVDMMTTNRHLPVPFPPTVSAPRHRTVKKVSHEGC